MSTTPASISGAYTGINRAFSIASVTSFAVGIAMLAVGIANLVQSSSGHVTYNTAFRSLFSRANETWNTTYPDFKNLVAEAVVDQVKYSLEFSEEAAQLEVPSDSYYHGSPGPTYTNARLSTFVNPSDSNLNLTLSDGNGNSKTYGFSAEVPRSLTGGSVPARLEVNLTQQDLKCTQSDCESYYPYYGCSWMPGSRCEYTCHSYESGIWDADKQVCTKVLYLKSLCFLVSKVDGAYILKDTNKYNGNVTKALIEGQMGCFYESYNVRYNISKFYPGIYQDSPVTGDISLQLRLDNDPLVVASNETNGSYYYYYSKGYGYGGSMLGVGLLIGGCLLISVGAVFGFAACGLACCRPKAHTGATYGMVMPTNSAVVYPATNAIHPSGMVAYPTAGPPVYPAGAAVYPMPPNQVPLMPQPSAYATSR